MNNVMNWAWNFLAQHPGEALIFQVQNETDSASTDAPIIYDYFRRLAREGLVYDGTWQELLTPGTIRSENFRFQYAIIQPDVYGGPEKTGPLSASPAVISLLPWTGVEGIMKKTGDHAQSNKGGYKNEMPTLPPA